MIENSKTKTGIVILAIAIVIILIIPGQLNGGSVPIATAEFTLTNTEYKDKPETFVVDAQILTKTEEYLRHLDFDHLYYKGADYDNPSYSPERIGL